MREKICVNGPQVALIRKRHTRWARQKVLAHELGISERKLRDIETTCAVLDLNFARRIATTLDCEIKEIVFSEAGPKLVSAVLTQENSRGATSGGRAALRGKQTYPRYDKESARQIGIDAGSLFESAHRAELIVVERHIALDAELSEYADELVGLAREVSREVNPYFLAEDDPRIPGIKSRMRWLMVQLKGHDVLVYTYDHTKYLPESDVVVPGGRYKEWQWQAFIAFAAPQEWGEESVEVQVDHGQPYVIDWDADLSCPRPVTPF